MYIVRKLIVEIQQRKIKKKNFKKLKRGHKTIKNMNVLILLYLIIICWNFSK
jgi:hypothetical protein